MLLTVSAATQWWAGRSQAQLGDKMAALAQVGFDAQPVLDALGRGAGAS